MRASRGHRSGVGRTAGASKRLAAVLCDLGTKSMTHVQPPDRRLGVPNNPPNAARNEKHGIDSPNSLACWSALDTPQHDGLAKTRANQRQNISRTQVLRANYIFGFDPNRALLHDN